MAVTSNACSKQRKKNCHRKENGYLTSCVKNEIKQDIMNDRPFEIKLKQMICTISWYTKMFISPHFKHKLS